MNKLLRVQSLIMARSELLDLMEGEQDRKVEEVWGDLRCILSRINNVLTIEGVLEDD